MTEARKQQDHTVEAKENSAGYVWVCSCGKVWAYGIDNLAEVNAHCGNEARKQSGDRCPDCDEAAKLAYSDATTPGFFSSRCKRHSGDAGKQAETPREAPEYDRLSQYRNLHYPTDAGFCSCGVLCETGTRYQKHLEEVAASAESVSSEAAPTPPDAEQSELAMFLACNSAIERDESLRGKATTMFRAGFYAAWRAGSVPSGAPSARIPYLMGWEAGVNAAAAWCYSRNGDHCVAAALRSLKPMNEPSGAPALESEIVIENLADYARRGFEGWDMYQNAWLREMGGVIVPKHHQIDGFVLRMRGIYEKAQLVDRIKQIMVKELKAKKTAEEMFDAVFKMLAEHKGDRVPTN